MLTGMKILGTAAIALGVFAVLLGALWEDARAVMLIAGAVVALLGVLFLFVKDDSKR